VQFTVHLRQEVADFIIQQAAENNMTPEAYAASVLTNMTLASSPDVPDQVSAEREFWEVIRKIHERLIQTDDWGPDVIRKLFEEIEHNHRELYERAIGGDAYEAGNPTKHRINIETASRTKTALKAVTRSTPGGHPVRGSVAKGLITAYTKLFRSDDEE
jgi:ribosomal protein S10